MEFESDMFRVIGEAYGERKLDPLPDFPPDTYEPTNFTITHFIERMHNWPRFGFTRDINSLVSGESEQQKDYITGIVVGSLIILGFGVIWLLVLLILKCCGKRVGCASGKPRRPVRPDISSAAEPSQIGFEVEDAPDESTKVIQVEEAVVPTKSEEQDYDAAMEEWGRKLKRHERSMLRTRIVFMLAGTAAIIASILFFTMGAGSLIQSLNSVQRGLNLTYDTLDDGINVSLTFARSQETINEDKGLFLESAKFCNATVEDGSIEAQVQAALNDAAQRAEKVTAGLIEAAYSMADDLRAAYALASDVDSSLDYIKPYFYVAIVFVVILDAIILTLMLSTGFAWSNRDSGSICCKRCFRCTRNIFAVPILIIFMFLSWLGCSIFVVAAVAGADFCVHPDGHVLTWLEQYEENFTEESIVLSFIKYYVSGCASSYEPLNIPDMLPKGFDLAVNTVHSFLEYGSTENELTDILNTICGGSADSVNELASIFHGQLHILYGTLVGVARVFQCESFNPIYSTTVHQGLCTDGVDGLAWIFSTQFAIAICCMIMVTLRASWYEVEKDDEEEDDEDEKEEEAAAALGDNDAPSDLELAQDLTTEENRFQAEEEQ
eukprot:CAMPEP_0178700600 /NCGR_PEP_ID=MMETSP0699-20121125/11770_1 /TAXON_ID=265572 /ORGANISM="Extubocellulus spinifer, Strain CCMP396" /LENGTH=606 /DNA_ID=CAMNT_0020346965 /DNA_START=159 /DNA_END=1979 /DNA_ORIENTATION=-